jgi:PAS domain S-box-containing protein
MRIVGAAKIAMPLLPRTLFRQILRGVLWALPLGAALALLRRYIGLFLAANAYRRAVLDYAVDGIILIDDAGNVQSFNPAAEKVFGYTTAEMVGQNLRRIIAPPDHVMYKLISIGREVTGIRKDGLTFPMDMTSGQMQLSAQRMYILIVRDVTRRKQIEDELRQARDAAEAASRAKSSFLLTMSHELRTPLNHIIGYGELLQEELHERGQQDLLPDLMHIDQAGRHLLRQIEDVLDLANIESGLIQLRMERFVLRTLLDELGHAIAPLLERNANRLILDETQAPTEMIADRARVRQVLYNVLSNAGKFTQHGVITVRVVAEFAVGSETPGALPQNDVVRFEISDTGVGMRAEQVAALFEPFQVENVTTRAHGGAGLGLAITRRLCRLMGGEISVISSPGEGSTFTVRLPLRN